MSVTLLKAINLSVGEVGHPVVQNCSITPLEQNAKSSPEVGDGFPLQLTGVPCQGTPQLLHFPLRTLVPAGQGLSHKGEKSDPLLPALLLGPPELTVVCKVSGMARLVGCCSVLERMEYCYIIGSMC